MAGAAGKDKYVKELLPADVLFGRGSGPNDHEGNIRFRQLVAERKTEYMATNHRMTKAKIAKEIVDQVFNANGRFMKKVEPADMKALGFAEGTDVWEIVDDDTIMEKAKQALRQNTQKHKGSSTASSSGSTGSGAAADEADHHHHHHKKHQLSAAAHHQIPPVAQTSPIARSGNRQHQQTSVNTRPGGFGDFEPLPISPASYDSSPGYSPPAQQQPAPAMRQHSGGGMHSMPHTNNGNMPPLPGGHHPHHHQQQAAPWSTDRMGNPMSSQVHPPPHPHHMPLQPQQLQQPHDMMRSQQMPPSRHMPKSASNSNNSMLSYIRRASYDIPPQQRPPHQQQQPPPPVPPVPPQDASNLSMAQLPDDMGGRAPRHGSIHLADLQNMRESRNNAQQQPQQPQQPGEMHDLMDSFSKMRATGELNPKFHASVDTMGTIEHINPGSIADMSLGTMGSSTFSLFRGNESLAAMDDKIAQVEAQVQAERGGSTDESAAGGSVKEEPPTPPPPSQEGSIHFGPGSEPPPTSGGSGMGAGAGGGGGAGAGGPHPSQLPNKSSISNNNATTGSSNNMSMNLSDVWTATARRKSSSTGTVMSGAFARSDAGNSSLGSSVSMASSSRNNELSFHPRPIGLMEEQPNNLDMTSMGSSSMSVLKAAYTINEDENQAINHPTATTTTIRPQTFYLGDRHTNPTATATTAGGGSSGGGDHEDS